uniref:hypothetical protein n=1 Tax=Photobacterium leiognathi TaxID=553611 RepID=UPI00387EA582
MLHSNGLTTALALHLLVLLWLRFWLALVANDIASSIPWLAHALVESPTFAQR